MRCRAEKPELPCLLHLLVNVVAAEKLIARIAGKCDTDLLFRERGDEHRRDLGRICHRLIEVKRQVGHQLQHILFGNPKRRMIAPEVPCNGFRIRRLIVRGIFEADRKRL